MNALRWAKQAANRVPVSPSRTATAPVEGPEPCFCHSLGLGELKAGDEPPKYVTAAIQRECLTRVLRDTALRHIRSDASSYPQFPQPAMKGRSTDAQQGQVEPEADPCRDIAHSLREAVDEFLHVGGKSCLKHRNRQIWFNR